MFVLKNHNDSIMEDELKKLNFFISKIDNFVCCFIVVDSYQDFNELKDKIDIKAIIVDDLKNNLDIKIIKDRVISGEKIILTELEQIYEFFSHGDLERNDGIYQFYQKFTESYRDRLWLNNKGQLYFVLTNNQYDRFYNPGLMRDNHFRTMITTTLDLTKNKILTK